MCQCFILWCCFHRGFIHVGVVNARIPNSWWWGQAHWSCEALAPKWAARASGHLLGSYEVGKLIIVISHGSLFWFNKMKLWNLHRYADPRPTQGLATPCTHPSFCTQWLFWATHHWFITRNQVTHCTTPGWGNLTQASQHFKETKFPDFSLMKSQNSMIIISTHFQSHMSYVIAVNYLQFKTL